MAPTFLPWSAGHILVFGFWLGFGFRVWVGSDPESCNPKLFRRPRQWQAVVKNMRSHRNYHGEMDQIRQEAFQRNTPFNYLFNLMQEPKKLVFLIPDTVQHRNQEP